MDREDIKPAIPAGYPILAALEKHLPRDAPHPGLRPRIRHDPRDLLSIILPLIGYPAGIAGIKRVQMLMKNFSPPTYLTSTTSNPHPTLSTPLAFHQIKSFHFIVNFIIQKPDEAIKL